MLRCEATSSPESKAKVTPREYKYTDLKELQSKLTLVATTKQNKNMDTIDTFDKVWFDMSS